MARRLKFFLPVLALLHKHTLIHTHTHKGIWVCVSCGKPTAITGSVLKKQYGGNSLVVQWLGLYTFTAWGLVWSLVGDLRSHRLQIRIFKKRRRRGLSLDAGGWRVEAVDLSSCQMNSHTYPSPPWWPAVIDPPLTDPAPAYRGLWPCGMSPQLGYRFISPPPHLLWG